jgi:hypothetical protein
MRRATFTNRALLALLASPEAGQALRESERWLKEGVEVSMERREENYKKIQAGITGRITKEQLEKIQALWACLG